jgi:hypothetical protein
LATTIRFKARRQGSQDVAALLPTGHHPTQHPLHEPAPTLAVGPTTDPPPDHRVSQRAFRRVVRRLDPLHPRERPQTLFHLEDLELIFDSTK